MGTKSRPTATNRTPEFHNSPKQMSLETMRNIGVAQRFAILLLLTASAGGQSRAVAQQTAPADDPLTSAQTPAPASDPLLDDTLADQSRVAPAEDPLAPDKPIIGESPRIAPDKLHEVRPLAGPREELTLLGVDESYIQLLMDGHPINSDEMESLWKILYAVNRFDVLDIEKWAHRDVSMKELASLPITHRCQIFLIDGTVLRVTPEKVLPEVVDQFQMEQYYRCEFQVQPDGEPAIVYARNVPKAWKLDQPIKERASFFGFFLKLAGGDDQPARPIFVTRRVAWHPRTLLGQAGMDLGLFDEATNRTPLRSQDRQCFYQLLGTVVTLHPSQLRFAANEQFDKWRESHSQQAKAKKLTQFPVVELIRNPGEYQGEIMGFEGTLRRAVEILVDDPDIVARYGLRKYYELEVFVDLGGVYKLDKDSDRRFRTYPVVFCVRNLPPEMPVGAKVNEQVRVQGVFMKVWSYQSGFAASKGENTRQMAPLFVGGMPTWYRNEESGNAFVGMIAGCLFVVALGGIWFGLWRYSRGDRKFRKQALGRQFEPPEGESLNDLRLDESP